jgi:hypothetical protein
MEKDKVKEIQKNNNYSEDYLRVGGGDNDRNIGRVLNKKETDVVVMSEKSNVYSLLKHYTELYNLIGTKVQGGTLVDIVKEQDENGNYRNRKGRVYYIINSPISKSEVWDMTENWKGKNIAREIEDIQNSAVGYIMSKKYAKGGNMDFGYFHYEIGGL